jgi:hypothetical protein
LAVKILPTSLQPGSTGVVEVQTTPPLAGEIVETVTLHTDSSLTPSIPLRVRVAGNRRPPFLLSAAGDLTYPSGASRTDRRIVIAVNIETASEDPRPPQVRSDLPFLRVGVPKIQEKPYNVIPGTVMRTYEFDVDFRADPPDSYFSGRVNVTDPWDSGRAQVIEVYGHAAADLRIVPARITLHPNNVESFDFLVITKEPAKGLVVEWA